MTLKVTFTSDRRWWVAGIALGVAAEWSRRPELLLPDAVAGFALLVLGLVVRPRCPRGWAGLVMAVAGSAWFLGTLWGPAVFWHRALLAQLLIGYPGVKPAPRVQRTGVAAAYLYAAVPVVAANGYVTVVFALGLVALTTTQQAAAIGPERRARRTSLTAAMAFALVLMAEAAVRLAGIGGGHVMLACYDLTICLIAAGLAADLIRGRWAQRAVTGLVVELGEPADGGVLRARLARTLDDPTLVIGYWLAGHDGYVDEAGRPVELPAASSERAVTPVEEDGKRVAVLVHDAALLDDPGLLSAVGAAARLALSNVLLQAEVTMRVREVEASRRRIVEAAGEQRRQLERELRDGAEQRLAFVADLLADCGEPLAEVRAGLGAAMAELREFGRGIHPAILTERGLEASVRELAERCPLPVEVAMPSARFPAAIEAAAYFVCVESLTNVAKHAGASHAQIGITQMSHRLTTVVADDGIGGAELSAGTGLRGLADRIEALGGQFTVDSPPSGGTRIVAELPLLFDHDLSV